MNKVRSVFRVARTEYIRWITNPRMIILGALGIMIYTLVSEPLLERATKYGAPLGVMEPFIALGNSGILVMLIPCIFLILVSDYPQISGNSIYYIQRIGCVRWFLGHAVFLVMAIFSMLMAIVGISMMTSMGTFQLKWSDSVVKYGAMFPSEVNGYAMQLLPGNLYNQLRLPTAFWQTFSLLFLYLYLLAQIIYFTKLMHAHSIGLIVVLAVIAGGVFTCSLKLPLQWIFPMAHTIGWIHYTSALREPIFPMWGSYVYLAGFNAMLFGANVMAAKKYQLMNIEHVE